jgi:hypothetical protein
MTAASLVEQMGCPTVARLAALSDRRTVVSRADKTADLWAEMLGDGTVANWADSWDESWVDPSAEVSAESLAQRKAHSLAGQ